MYSFGDSSNFPLRENFLESLMATVRASAALFRCECEQDESTRHIREARKAADMELAKLIGFQNALVATLNTAEGPASEQAAQALSQAAAKILGRTRHEVTARRDELIVQSTPKNVSGRVQKILSDFWLSSQLPYTRWTFHWRQDPEGKMRASVRATAATMAANFRTAISQSDFWGAPIAIVSMMPALSISVPIWTRKIRGTDTSLESMESWEVIEVEASQSRQRLVLQRTGKQKSKQSLMITLADAAQTSPTMVLLGEADETIGEIHHLRAQDAEGLAKLWTLLMEERANLVELRSSLGEVTIGNQSVGSITHPSEVAEMLLQAVAPLTREVRLRSRVPGELILKRQIGEGRREEIFMSRDALQVQYQDLPDQYRRVFDAMGLGSESTCDFVTMLGEEIEDEPTKANQRQKKRKSHYSELDSELDSVLLDIDAA